MLNLDDIQFIISENERLLARAEQLESGPGGIMEMKQTIADKEKEIERLKDHVHLLSQLGNVGVFVEQIHAIDPNGAAGRMLQ